MCRMRRDKSNLWFRCVLHGTQTNPQVCGHVLSVRKNPDGGPLIFHVTHTGCCCQKAFQVSLAASDSGQRLDFGASRKPFMLCSDQMRNTSRLQFILISSTSHNRHTTRETPPSSLVAGINQFPTIVHKVTRFRFGSSWCQRGSTNRTRSMFNFTQPWIVGKTEGLVATIPPTRIKDEQLVQIAWSWCLVMDQTDTSTSWCHDMVPVLVRMIIVAI
mmetsp:Transcript_13806/g.32111  ORF Transcript_13806/g.32111 Transcript_13806/m.32111 type:complete len:216 (-) Transcript_13806:49-696(-)